jgi:hypothetical protein
MTLKDVATVSGKGGLFKILKPAKGGMILESMDDARTKMVATPSHRLSVLEEISIYTTTKEGTVQLGEVLNKIHSEFGTDPGLDADADPAELRSFMKSVLPEYDEARVYPSDIRKLVKWFSILASHAPELLHKPSEDAESSGQT